MTQQREPLRWRSNTLGSWAWVLVAVTCLFATAALPLMAVAQDGSTPAATAPSASDLQAQGEQALAAGRSSQALELLLNAGMLFMGAGQLDQAVNAFEQACAAIPQPGTSPVDARRGTLAQVFLGDILRRLRRFDEALHWLELAAKDIRAVGHRDMEYMLHDALGEVLLELGQPAAAEQSFVRFADFAGQKQDQASRALALSRQARARAALGDASAARTRHAEALALTAEHPHPSYTCQVQIAAGRFEEQQGGYDAARQLYEQAHANLPPGAWDLEVMIVGHLGNVHMSQGRYGAARSCIDRVAELCATDDGRMFGPALMRARAELALKLGDNHEARRLYSSILEGDGLSLGSQEHIETLSGLAEVLQALGEDTPAVQTAGQALEMARTTGDAVALGHTHHLLGEILVQQQDYETALGHFDAALTLAREQANPSDEALALGGLAYSQVREGATATGEQTALQALALHEQLGEPDRVLDVLHTLALAALGRRDAPHTRELLEQAAELLADVNETATDPLAAADLRSRYVAFSRVAQDLTAHGLEARDLDADAAQTLIVAGLKDAGRWKGRALLDALALRRRSLASSREADSIPAHDDNRGLLADLTASLGPRRALIEYVEGDEQLYAYVLDTRGLRFVRLGPRAALQARADEYLAGISNIEQLLGATQVAEQGHALAQGLLMPLLDELSEGITNLVVVPTPMLARLPLEALVLEPLPESARRPKFDEITFVADRYHMTYSPSTLALVELARIGPRPSPAPALILGDPIYASEIREATTATTSPLQPAHLPRLIGTRREALTVASHMLQRPRSTHVEKRDTLDELAELAQARNVHFTHQDFTLLMGADASRARLLEQDLSGYGVIHLATHGLVDPDDPTRTGLLLSLETSSIAPDGYQSILGLDDIRQMHLDADLVVLSACDSARGPVVRGEGVHSMARAFLQAGARSVVASLWQIQDQETQLAMEAFYAQHRHAGQSPAYAARRAKPPREPDPAASRGVSLGGRGPRLAPGHPYLWAPFIWIGALPPLPDT